MAEIRHLFETEMALLRFESEACVDQSLKDIAKVLDVLFPCP